MLREFLHYRSPPLSAAGVGESLRTKSVADAYERVRHFIITATDASAPASAQLRIYKADDAAEDPLPMAVQSAQQRFGMGAREELSSEVYWEWGAEPGEEHASRVAAFVAFTAECERLPRVWVNSTLRRHEMPKRPQVETRLTWRFWLTDERGSVLPQQEPALYLPGWDLPSRLILELGTNRIDLAIKLPLDGAALEACVARIEEALGHELKRGNFRRVRLNQDATAYVERRL